MTKIELQRIEERVKVLVPGAWEWVGGVLWAIRANGTRTPIIDTDQGFKPPFDEAEREFIAKARTDIPRLLAEVRRLQEELELEPWQRGQ